MSDTTYTDFVGPPVNAAWLNDVNNAVYHGVFPGGFPTVPVVSGGTGASTAAGARTNLGAAPIASPTFTGTVTAPAFSGPLTGNASTASSLSAASTLPNGTLATTQANTDSSTNIATTAFANPAASLAASGYVKLPSGVIIQWGTGTLVNGTLSVTFPVTFPNSCRSVVSQYSALTTQGSYSSIGAGSITTSGFTAWSNTGVAIPFNWIAIGN